MNNLRKINNDAITQLNQVRTQIALIQERIQNKLQEEKDIQSRVTCLLQNFQVIQNHLAEAQKQEKECRDLTLEIAQKRAELKVIIGNNHTAILNGKERLKIELEGLNFLRESIIEKTKVSENELYLKSKEIKEKEEQLKLIDKEYKEKIEAGEKRLTELAASYQAEKDEMIKQRGMVRKEQEALSKEKESIEGARHLIDLLTKENNIQTQWQESSPD